LIASVSPAMAANGSQISCACALGPTARNILRQHRLHERNLHSRVVAGVAIHIEKARVTNIHLARQILEWSPPVNRRQNQPGHRLVHALL
jgi:hypothetical protein